MLIACPERHRGANRPDIETYLQNNEDDLNASAIGGSGDCSAGLRERQIDRPLTFVTTESSEVKTLGPLSTPHDFITMSPP